MDAVINRLCELALKQIKIEKVQNCINNSKMTYILLASENWWICMRKGVLPTELPHLVNGSFGSWISGDKNGHLNNIGGKEGVKMVKQCFFGGAMKLPQTSDFQIRIIYGAKLMSEKSYYLEILSGSERS